MFVYPSFAFQSHKDITFVSNGVKVRLNKSPSWQIRHTMYKKLKHILNGMTVILPNVYVITGKRAYSDGRVYVGKEYEGKDVLFVVSPDFLSGEINSDKTTIEDMSLKYGGIGLRTVGEDGRISIGRPHKGEWAVLLILKDLSKEKKKEIEEVVEKGSR